MIFMRRPPPLASDLLTSRYRVSRPPRTPGPEREPVLTSAHDGPGSAGVERCHEIEVPTDERLALDAAAVRTVTGWELKPHGLCRDAVCRPARLGDSVELPELAALLRRPLALEELATRTVAVLGEPVGSTVQAGATAPPLALPALDGSAVELTRRGRRTVLVVWSTWCGCRYELPSWAALANELEPLGVDVVTIALDDDLDAVRTWTSRAPQLPTAIDADHLVSDVFGVVNVPSAVWLDADGTVVKAPTIAPGDDRFLDFTEVRADVHHDAVRSWAAGGTPPAADAAPEWAELRAARAERRLAAWLHRNGHAAAAERHFAKAVALAPLDFSIRRASMPRRGQDPFGAEFAELWQEWSAADRPDYRATAG